MNSTQLNSTQLNSTQLNSTQLNSSSAKPLKIGYFADGIWSHNAFKKINSNPNFKIEFIVPRFNSHDNILKSFAKEFNIEFLNTKNINSKEFIEQIAKFKCDILVSMSFDQIFKKEILSLCPYGVINCHAGKLPFYRGRNILNWVLINDEKEFGITTHFVNEGIDTGDIIVQKCYKISDEDDYKSLLELAHTECAVVLNEALEQIYKGTFKRIKQSGAFSYTSKREAGDEIINWNQTSREIWNFIRAITLPAIGATSFINGKEIKIYKAQLIKDAINYKCKNGAIIGFEGDFFFVKTADNMLKITDYKFDKKLKIGDILN